MDKRKIIKGVFGGDPKAIAELQTPKALSGVWFGAMKDKQRLYQTAEGIYSIEELTSINEDRPGNWQCIDIGSEPGDNLWCPVPGAGRPVSSKRTAIERFFGLTD